MPFTSGYYIMLLSIHGLLRGREPELGRDADTGGQILYVLELARALSGHPDVEKVDLVTRRITDSRVDDDYSVEIEPLTDSASIVRIPCGPSRYIHKESLWPYLDAFVDNTTKYLRSLGRAPDLIHGHYADAGYVAAMLSGVLVVPAAFTGHSLGRIKRRRLLDSGSKPEAIEKRYRMSRRIEAEETVLDHAAFVVASTRQEVREQYEVYDHYQPRRMLVIPPGVNLDRFSPPRRGLARRSPVYAKLEPFLSDMRKPMILAISRADPRKNIATLIRAYGGNPALRDKANLVLVAGNREAIGDLDKGAREVMSEILQLVDEFDLYGSVAYPKQHNPDEVPEFYRSAARSRGVFVNPALTEPFGLTLLEAAASGLPVVATHDGGPRDIIERCRNGLLVDPLDATAMGQALLSALSDAARWRKWARAGISGAHRHFAWSAHVSKYVRAVKTAVNRSQRTHRVFGAKSRLITADRIVVSDIDNTLIGDREALHKLLQILRDAGDKVAFGIATGRSIELTLKVLRQWKIPMPQLLLTSVGSAIHYGPKLIEDKGWEKHINYRWRPNALRRAMTDVPGLKLQKPEGQGRFKVSFDADPELVPELDEILTHLRRSHLQARVIYSHQAYLDLLPIRASKGMALRHFALNWGIPLERCLVAGDSGNDEEMLTGNTLGVVVGNHDEELEKLRGHPQVYFASGHHAWGIIEGIETYDFLGEIRPAPAEALPDAVAD